MPSAPSPSSYTQEVSLRRRAVAFALALAANLLLLLMLIGIAPEWHRPPGGGTRPTLTTFPLGQAERQQTASRATPKARSTARRATTPAAASPRTPPPPVPHESELWQPPPGMLMLNKDDYASADISRLPTHAPAQSAGDADATETASSGEGASAGTGPHGERLFEARWRREPTDAELSTYLPKRNPGEGYGEVACRTIERFHVEDCEELGESPAGSGYARAVREAAWQFLVWPPRVGGRTLVGSWVRIRITYEERHASAH